MDCRTWRQTVHVLSDRLQALTSLSSLLRFCSSTALLAGGFLVVVALLLPDVGSLALLPSVVGLVGVVANIPIIVRIADLELTIESWLDAGAQRGWYYDLGCFDSEP